jgi:serine/threonine-protein kinase
MGVVWRAWIFFAPDGPRAVERPVPLALKVLRAHGAEPSGMRALFTNEAEALKRLHHPNIVAFQDFFEWDGALALAMELVEGSTLEDLVSRHRARAKLAGVGTAPGVPVGRAWYYFQQLLGALAATHALGLVHRDVKPSNILIRGDGIVKLSDYGIARLAADSVPAPSGAAMAAGTGAYMSPEQVLSRAVDARSDLYSAAIVFYEMLAGRPPFSPDEKNEFSLRQDQVESPPPPIRRFVPHAPAALEPVFARAMAKDPQYRFTSAVEMGDAIRVALGERETPEWRAQRELASQAPAPPGEQEGALSVRALKLQTLREFVVSGYQASSPTR